jgi:hypothetical protein
LGAVRKGNLEKMHNLAEEVKARAPIGQDIIGDKKARAAERQAATVGALVDVSCKSARK